MATIKKNWLRAGISLFVLLLGVFYIVKATEMEVGKNNIVMQQRWYSTDASGQNIGVLLTSPPPSVGGEGCDQLNSGDFCAKLLEFDASVNPEDLEGLSIADIENDITDVEERGAAKHLPSN